MVRSGCQGSGERLVPQVAGCCWDVTERRCPPSIYFLYRRKCGGAEAAGVCSGPRATRAAGRQVGCTPYCTETLRPQTKQRVRALVRSHSGGTSPRRLPDRCGSMRSFMGPMFAHPPISSYITAQATGNRAKDPGGCCRASIIKGAVTHEVAPAARGERLRWRPPFPSKGVPGNETIAAITWKIPDPNK